MFKSVRRLPFMVNARKGAIWNSKTYSNMESANARFKTMIDEGADIVRLKETKTNKTIKSSVRLTFVKSTTKHNVLLCSRYLL